MASSKYLPASSRKLHKSRLDGDVAKSRDLTSTLMLTIGFIYIFYLINSLEIFIHQFRVHLRLTGGFHSNNMIEYADLAFQRTAGFLAIFFGLMVAVAVVVESLQVGIYFSLKPLALNFDKLNPFEGIKKNILKLPDSGALIVEIIKMVTVIISSIAIWLLLLKQYSALFVPALSFNPSVYFLLAYLVLTSLMLLLIAAADYLFVRLKRSKRLRMDVNEFRQEMRESEGDPHLKGMRKQLHQELGMQASLDVVRRAKILLVGKENN